MGWVLFFDGECAFCSASVRRVAGLDKEGRVNFAPLQGKLAAEKGLTRYVAQDGSMVLIRESDGRVFTHSSGLLELMNALGGVWRVFMVFKLVPRFLRDVVYRWVARNRYKFMGKTNACGLPDPVLLRRLRE